MSVVHLNSAAGASLLLLDLVVAPVSTTVAQTFACQRFGDELVLRSSPTTVCSGLSDPRRRGWILYATAMMILYPIGVPSLNLALMMPHRQKIGKLAGALSQQDQALKRSSGVLDLAQDPRQRRSVTAAAGQLTWLAQKFDVYRNGYWWYAVFQLVIRLLQTSGMVLM